MPTWPQLRQQFAELQLQHKDSGGNLRDVCTARDVALAVRHKGRVLGELWEFVLAHLNNWPPPKKPQNLQLGSSNGRPFLMMSIRPIELCSTSIDDSNNLCVFPTEGNLAFVGFACAY
jgi:hypothetical protein